MKIHGDFVVSFEGVYILYKKITKHILNSMYVFSGMGISQYSLQQKQNSKARWPN